MKQLDCYIYYRMGLNLYEKVTSDIRGKYNLSYMELVILMFLANNSEYKKASDIVDILGIAKSHVSINVNSLVNKDFIERKDDENDRRSSVLAIKDNAMEIIEEGRKVQKHYIEMIFKGMDEKDMSEFTKYQKIIERNIKENL